MRWALAAGAAAVAAVLAVGVAFAAHSGTTPAFHPPSSSASHAVAPASTGGPVSPTASGDRPTAAGSAAGPTGSAQPHGEVCGLPGPGSAACITTPECYDSAKKRVACGGRHTWEAFAFADLPSGVRPADARQNAEVREVCSRFTLLQVDPDTALRPWQIDVLLPGSGRTYRCLAGMGPNALTGPQLTKG